MVIILVTVKVLMVRSNIMVKDRVSSDLTTGQLFRFIKKTSCIAFRNRQPILGYLAGIQL